MDETFKMNPQRFAHANCVMKAPKGMPECADVHSFRDGLQVITAWRPTPEELVQINLGNPIWLYCVGKSMPPVALVMDDPFYTEETFDMTQQQIDELNAQQNSGLYPPLTCGKRHDEGHVKYQDEHGGDLGQLVAHADGWHCPVCDYCQVYGRR